jgi:hypothetical protein
MNVRRFCTAWCLSSALGNDDAERTCRSRDGLSIAITQLGPAGNAVRHIDHCLPHSLLRWRTGRRHGEAHALLWTLSWDL